MASNAKPTLKYKIEYKVASPPPPPLLLDSWREVHCALWRKRSNSNGGGTADEPPPMLPKPAASALNIDDDIDELWAASINLAAMPFHHLLEAQKMTSYFDARKRWRGTGDDGSGYDDELENRRWRARRKHLICASLAASRVPAQEIVLLEDGLQFKLVRPGANETLDLEWLSFSYDDLEGCAEMYRADMMTVKRRVYEAGDDLRERIEITNAELNGHLDDDALAALGERSARRFLFARIANLFELTATNELHPVGDGGGSDSGSGDGGGGKRKRYSMSMMLSLNRFVSLDISSDDSDAAVRCGLDLSGYWLYWQRVALAAGLDFSMLERVRDARAMRFYELTKLQRGFSMLKAGGGGAPQRTLEVGYAEFASMMPIKRMHGAEAMREQIKELAKPLRAVGYAVNFTLEENGGLKSMFSDATVKFVFND